MITSGRSCLKAVYSSDQLIEEKYRIERLLGQGSLSAVYRALRLVDATPVTITVLLLPNSFSQDEASRFMARFSQEAIALMKLMHSSILPTYDYGRYEEQPYLVSGYKEGRSLAYLLKERGRYTIQETLSVLERIAPALDYAHQHGVHHCILKPANILCNHDQIFLTGFGLARIVQRERSIQELHPSLQFLTIAGTYIGSPEYLAPEWVTGQPVGASADIYALGVILFEMLTGKTPFQADSFIQTACLPLARLFPSVTCCPDLPQALDEVLRRATSIDQDQRFERAEDLLEAYITATRLHGTHKHYLNEARNASYTFHSTNGQRVTEPIVKELIEVPNEDTHHIVGLTELRLAPWSTLEESHQAIPVDSSSSGIAEEIEKLLEAALLPQESSQEGSSKVTAPQPPIAQTIAATQESPAPISKRGIFPFAIHTDIILKVFTRRSRRGENGNLQAPQAVVRQQVFSTVSKNFPAQVEVFAPRKDTFPSRQSREGNVKREAARDLRAPDRGTRLQPTSNTE